MNAYIKGAIAAVIVMAVIFFWYRANQDSLPVNQSPVGFKLIDKMEREGVPDFELQRMDGTRLKLSSLKGKVVVLNFWASWCNPCVEEFPSMMKLVSEMKGEVVVVAVSTDEEKKDIGPFLKAFGLPKPGFEVVWDSDKAIMKAFEIDKVPESFVIGRDMKLARKVLGIENWSTPGALEYFKLLTK